MMLYRTAKKEINQWINSGEDALLVTGARQIGKTSLIRQCLRESGLNYIEINFVEKPELISLFDSAKSTEDFMMRLSLATDQDLIPNHTVIFFDEIQEVKEIVTRIKFLVQDKKYKYIMSGSLLGIELSDLRSAPVGYLRIIDMYPMGFYEFLVALGIKNDVLEVLRQSFKQKKQVDEFIHDKILDSFYLYLIVGGMPEAVNEYVETNNLRRVDDVHQKIKELYKMDFSKYERNYKLKLKEIYDAMPSQLNSQNKRFQLNEIDHGISYDRVENSFLWLKDAGVALPVYNVTEPQLPLEINAKRNLFKLFFSDVGLLTSYYSDQLKISILNKSKNINNGSLFENVVAQELYLHNLRGYYFNNKKQGELDFVVEIDGKIIPIEIKSGKDYKRHSALNNALENKNYGIEEAYIFCNDNVHVLEKKIYFPIYMIMFLEDTKIEEFTFKLDLSQLQ